MQILSSFFSPSHIKEALLNVDVGHLEEFSPQFSEAFLCIGLRQVLGFDHIGRNVDRRQRLLVALGRRWEHGQPDYQDNTVY